MPAMPAPVGCVSDRECACFCAWAWPIFCRWGTKLSTKLFVARKFVVKHIRSKQEEKLQAEKERVGVFSCWMCSTCVKCEWEKLEQGAEEEKAGNEAEMACSNLCSLNC
eukprot:1150171-Pelagomonas_calceolata.AAC.9